METIPSCFLAHHPPHTTMSFPLLLCWKLEFLQFPAYGRKNPKGQLLSIHACNLPFLNRFRQPNATVLGDPNAVPSPQWSNPTHSIKTVNLKVLFWKTLVLKGIASPSFCPTFYQVIFFCLLCMEFPRGQPEHRAKTGVNTSESSIQPKIMPMDYESWRKDSKKNQIYQIRWHSFS